jgi:hypothetical protein
MTQLDPSPTPPPPGAAIPTVTGSHTNGGS